MLYIFTGNGKGKTTAALGQALRAVGEGKKVLMVQFIKGPWKSGEDNIEIGLRSNPSTHSTIAQGGEQGRTTSSGSPVFQLVKKGKGFVGILGDSLPREEHEQAARDALIYTREQIQEKKWDLLILDEVNNAVQLNLITKEDVLELLEWSEDKIEHCILTGRDAPPEFIAKADLVTQMQDLKHPYEKGVKGRRGLEY